MDDGRLRGSGLATSRDGRTARAGDSDADARFQASSISKQFVAAAAMLLVERGQLNLVDPIGRWLGDTPAAWDRITLHHLLCQTAGFGHWADLPDFSILTPPDLDGLIALLRSRPLLSTPGETWRYSGPGYALAGRVIERAAGQPYSQFLADNVIRPLGMSGTTSGSNPPGAAGSNDGVPVPLVPGLAGLPGTGDLWTTTRDLELYARALADGRLLSAASVDAMSTPHATPPDDAHDPEDFARATGYGYGYFLGTLGGHPARFHPGDNPGFASFLGWLPEDRTCVVVLSSDEETKVEDVARSLIADLA